MYFMVMILVFLISSFMLLLMFMVSMWQYYNINYSSSYECGFDPKSFTRISFSYRFFLISILFLIFDVEITLLMPIPFLVQSYYSMFMLAFFVMILLFGLMYEMWAGSLDWL
uniref:NADH-ubiquinone oxidoreductase chain 3 n=1 Tax=Parachtes romandiolae TaxID=1110492 RepID=A0A516IMD4_9ARAC|nr:NADH dehydrogenase subunit 3 [Parachtes romandiolae]QDP17910.1 NADH dehydrogenase subunit 3 [Parachtes romandiolae]